MQFSLCLQQPSSLPNWPLMGKAIYVVSDPNCPTLGREGPHILSAFTLLSSLRARPLLTHPFTPEDSQCLQNIPWGQEHMTR